MKKCRSKIVPGEREGMGVSVTPPKVPALAKERWWLKLTWKSGLRLWIALRPEFANEALEGQFLVFQGFKRGFADLAEEGTKAGVS